MRLRFFIFISLASLAAIIGVVLFIRIEAPNLVQTFLFRGGILGVDGLVRSLEIFHRQNQGWDGVEKVFDRHAQSTLGMGNRRRVNRMMEMTLVDVEGKVQYSSNAGQPEDSFSSEELDRAIPLRNLRGQTVGYLLVAGGANVIPGDEGSLLQALNAAALRAGLIALGVALILALVLAGSLLRPVRDLTRAAQKMAAGDLSQRVAEVGGDEIETLAKSFNQMAESLQNSEMRRKSLTADIAHELRTPLSVQRAQLEAMLDGLYPVTEENLTKSLAQNHLLSRLVDDLRTLALADAGELGMDRVSIDLAALTERIIERFQMADNGKDFQLDNEGGEEIIILGDPARIEQILSNLMSNASRYTPIGGRIQIKLTMIKPNQVELTVHDSGPGIPPEALGRIFDRFYRGEASRARSQGGSGLGLAIARQLALAHNGTLTAENHPKCGAVFRLTLPIGLPKI